MGRAEVQLAVGGVCVFTIECVIERQDRLELLPGKLEEAMTTLRCDSRTAGYNIAPPSRPDGDTMYIRRLDRAGVTSLERVALVDLVATVLRECGLVAISLSYRER